MNKRSPWLAALAAMFLLLFGANPAQAARSYTNASLEKMAFGANQDTMPDGEVLHRLEVQIGMFHRTIRDRAIAAGLDPATLPARWTALDYNNVRDRFGYFQTTNDWRAHAVNVKFAAGILAQASQLSPVEGAMLASELHRASRDAWGLGRAHDQWKLFMKRIAANSRFRNLISFSIGCVEFGKDPTDPEPVQTTKPGVLAPTVTTVLTITQTSQPTTATATVTTAPSMAVQPLVRSSLEQSDTSSAPKVLMAKEYSGSYSGNVPSVLMASRT